ncbi:MAG: hypothetical protein C4575_13530 [Desulforudis sp.]|nr:MAG: hypothetical protein C4575_13530 [Desulforudis sp.]
MAVTRNFDYPSFSTLSLETFLKSAAEARPNRVDLTYLTEFVGLPAKNADLLLSGLLTLGFINSDGGVTMEGRLAVSDQTRPSAFGSAFTRVYGEMLVVLLENDEFNLDQVHQFLDARTDLKLSGRQKVAAVFRYLLLNGDREDIKARFSQKKCFAT